MKRLQNDDASAGIQRDHAPPKPDEQHEIPDELSGQSVSVDPARVRRVLDEAEDDLRDRESPSRSAAGEASLPPPEPAPPVDGAASDGGQTAAPEPATSARRPGPDASELAGSVARALQDLVPSPGPAPPRPRPVTAGVDLAGSVSQALSRLEGSPDAGD